MSDWKSKPTYDEFSKGLAEWTNQPKKKKKEKEDNDKAVS